MHNKKPITIDELAEKCGLSIYWLDETYVNIQRDGRAIKGLSDIEKKAAHNWLCGYAYARGLGCYRVITS